MLANYEVTYDEGGNFTAGTSLRLFFPAYDLSLWVAYVFTDKHVQMIAR